MYFGKAGVVLTADVLHGQALQAGELVADGQDVLVGECRIHVKGTGGNGILALAVCAGDDLYLQFGGGICTLCLNETPPLSWEMLTLWGGALPLHSYT